MSAFVANGNRVRIQVSIFAFLTLCCLACKRDAATYNFDDASEEAQQAIAGNVDFTLTEDVFQKWEKAQANLEKLPSSELDAVPDPGGKDPVARGIKRLEGSAPARRAIESAGLSVKTFVFATVALAQAVKASQGGVPPTVGAIASNVRFVLAHAGRVASHGAADVWVPPSELSQEDIAAHQTMRMDSTEHANDMNSEMSQQPVPPVEDASRSQNPPQPQPPLPSPRPRDTRNPVQSTPQVLTNPPTPPPTRDSSATTNPAPPPPKTDSLNNQAR